MLRDVADRKDESGALTWGPGVPAWREIDRALRSIATRRTALDAEEMRWIREAEAAQIWRPLGMVNLLDYLERTFGYTPRVAQERIRVARALDQLPLLTGSLATGALAFSAVRELTRVVTPGTEATWVERARGKNLRQIEDLVAGHRPGDNPDDPPDPELRTHVLRYEISGPTKALLRQVRVEIEDELGMRLDDDAFLSTLARRAVDGPSAEAPSGRATFQIGITLCRACKQAWQDGGGATVAIDAAAFERAACNAQHIGAVDAAMPERAYQDISPAVARLVLHRDHQRCRVPGCRSARALELHHIVHREHGGAHTPLNLVTLCDAHHTAHHDGRLSISGTADDLRVSMSLDAHGPHVGACAENLDAGDPRGPHVGGSDERRAGVQDVHAPHVGGFGEDRPGVRDDPREAHPDHAPDDAPVGTDPRRPASSRYGAAVTRAQAVQALRGAGWSPSIARNAVDAALAALDADAPIDRVILEALRRCPRPGG